MYDEENAEYVLYGLWGWNSHFCIFSMEKSPRKIYNMHTCSCVSSVAVKSAVERNHVGGNMTMKSTSDVTVLPHRKVGLLSGEMGWIFAFSSQH